MSGVHEHFFSGRFTGGSRVDVSVLLVSGGDTSATSSPRRIVRKLWSGLIRRYLRSETIPLINALVDVDIKISLSTALSEAEAPDLFLRALSRDHAPLSRVVVPN